MAAKKKRKTAKKKRKVTKKKAAAKRAVKVRLKLTPEQEAELAKAFGKASVRRIKNISIEKIAGYLASDVGMN
ncbi:MAG: helix-turn-helix domain-containing protein [Gammaproteobacteria bacterium]|nr:helix-turn-helix domain-containing protein [Gammaproteobacteria bacterium]MDH3408426.1 helix-turn-helix domain-containing protein [Gammaproteobacteria bacterium]